MKTQPKTGRTRLWVELVCRHFVTIPESRSGVAWDPGLRCPHGDGIQRIRSMEGPKLLADMFRF
jgi:hypothetical protein